MSSLSEFHQKLAELGIPTFQPSTKQYLYLNDYLNYIRYNPVTSNRIIKLRDCFKYRKIESTGESQRWVTLKKRPLSSSSILSSSSLEDPTSTGKESSATESTEQTDIYEYMKKIAAKDPSLNGSIEDESGEFFNIKKKHEKKKAHESKKKDKRKRDREDQDWDEGEQVVRDASNSETEIKIQKKESAKQKKEYDENGNETLHNSSKKERRKRQKLEKSD